jgi:hypothetical protein
MFWESCFDVHCAPIARTRSRVARLSGLDSSAEEFLVSDPLFSSVAPKNEPLPLPVMQASSSGGSKISMNASV